MNNKDLGTEKIGRLLLHLSVPSIIAQLINLVYNIVDRIYLGRLPGEGTIVLTGLGLTLPIVNIISACAGWIGFGGAPLVAIALGRKAKKEAEEIVGNCLTMLLIVSTIMMSLLFFFSGRLLILLGANGDSYLYAMKYMRVYIVGTIFVMLASGLNPFMITQGFNKTSMKYSVCCMVLNIILDPIFIYTCKLGLEGAALATILSQFINAALVLRFLIKEKSNFQLKLSKLQPQVCSKVLTLGFANFFMGTTESFVQSAFLKQIAIYGNDYYLAAISVLFSINSCIMLPIQGVGQGAQPILGYNYGAGNVSRLKKTIRLFVTVDVIISFSLVCIVEAIPAVLIKIFTTDPEVIKVGVGALRLYILGRAISGIQLGLQNMFSALGYGKTAIFNAGMRKLVYLIPLIYIMPLIGGLGINGVFLAETVADTLAAMTATTVFFLMRKRIYRNASSMKLENS